MEIYKVHVLDNTGVTIKIVAFSGSLIQDIDNPKIFSDSEREYMKTRQITPIYIPSQIHPDDSIRIIKKKLITIFDNLSYDEIYLFSRINTEKSIHSLYDSVYKKGNNSLDSLTFSQILKNISLEPEDFQEKPEYSLEDLQSILPKERINKLSLGINFADVNDESFPYNPFDLLPEFYYEGTSDNALLSLDNRLLMNFSRELIDNTIYLSFAADIFDFLERNGNNIQKTFPLYYPLLAKQGIYDKPTFLKKQPKLVKETKKIIDKKSSQLYENVDFLYDVFYTKTDELPYIERGIKSLQICIHPKEIQLLPLDAIFKNIHATKETPFIKYNPGARRENIYRLFSTKLNKYGSKIPFLSRTKIIQLSKNIGKSKQISFFIPYLDNGKQTDILLTLTQNSNIYIECVFESAKLDTEINHIFIDNINPVLNKINTFLNQTGYQLDMFNNIIDDTVEVVKMKYYCKVPGKITAIKEGYILSLFDVIEDNIAKGAILKYKRVENYEEMNAETSMIMEWFSGNERINREEIISLLMSFSNIEREEALLRINNFLGNHTIIKGKYVNSNEDILENAGFLTKMGLIYDDESVFIEIDDIHSMDYVEPIQIYIDSILRLKLFSDTTEIDQMRLINAAKQITNIQNVDKSHIENVVEVTKAKPLVFGRSTSEEEDEYEGLVFDYDEDEDEEHPGIDDTDFISNLDEYQDATLDEIEVIETDMPEISSIVKKDIDEPHDEDEEEDEGFVFDYDEDEDEDEDESEDEDENKKTGGSTGEELDGLLLREKNNNIFLKRLKRKEPTLYLTQDIGKQYARYSRLCQSYKQPVIISKAEKNKIDAESPGSYVNALEYGTDPNNKNFYICPRFWCLKTNTSITEDQVKSGMCGKVIPQDAKVVPPGHYVYEFDRQKHLNPGFLTSDNLHPEGHCLPCCFKNFDSKLQNNKRDKCENKQSITTTAKPSEKNLSILKIEAIPVDQYRFGFLPMNIQRFFQIDYSMVVDRNNPSLLIGETLLRYGVPQSKNKSFIGCISDLYCKKRGITPTLSIDKMCEVIIDSISIERFIKAHNGTLPAVFRTKKINEILYKKYEEDSVFIKSLDLTNESQKRFLDETLSSYEHFLDFIRKDNLIDYTYLWDIICEPNPKLFTSGVNLAILDVTENDITDNIEIICPSSAYSKIYYDKRKETIILVKNNEIYEPIYQISPTENQYTFLENKEDNTINDELKQVLRIIRKTSQNYCAPISSIRKYEFKRNKMAEDVRLNLVKYKYTILSQILNSQGKIIGFYINTPEGNIMIPCLPSSIIFNDSIPIKYIDDPDLWTDYKKTHDLLKSVNEKSEGNIYSKPEIKVIEDGLIIGILTETNQFIQIEPPSENLGNDDLKEMNGSKYILADKNISSRTQDYERIKKIKMINLETQFYSSFRSLIRILLNEYENNEYKKQIMKYIENQNSKYTYEYRLKSIEYIIRKIAKKYVQFRRFSEKVLMSFNDITNCLEFTPEDIEKKKPLRCIMIDSKRVLVCPKNHLLSGMDNNIIYFGRIADELLRYKRIQSFMLDPKTFLNISKVNYSILENEMILLESLLTKSYFEDLIPRNQANKINITYDMAYPKISQKYSDKINISAQEKTLQHHSKENEFDILCIKEIDDVEGNKHENIWIRRFPTTVKEIFFNNESRECTFYPIIYIFREIVKAEVTISQIQENLKNAYNKILPMYENEIIDILKKQGKFGMMKLVENGRTSFENIIMSDGYYLTNLDIWVLANESNIPIILFTSNKLKNLENSVNWLRLGGKTTDKYYFLRAYTEPVPSNRYGDYHIIRPALNLNEVKGFEKMVNDGLIGDKDYSKNVQKLTDFLSKYQIK